MRVLLWILLAVVVLAGAGLAWLALRSPDSGRRRPRRSRPRPRGWPGASTSPSTSSTASAATPTSTTTASRVPVKAGTEGQGGFPFDKKLGVPGLVQAQNITPDPETGLGHWTDGEVLRAMREGVDRKGVALFPMMPYEDFREMSDEDARAIVAYLRTLKPIRHAVAPRRLDFPVNLLDQVRAEARRRPDRDAGPEGRARVRQVPRHDRGLRHLPHAASTPRASRSPARSSRAAG